MTFGKLPATADNTVLEIITERPHHPQKSIDKG